MDPRGRIVTQLTDDHVAELATMALASGLAEWCPHCRIAAVPDVVMIQGLANGEAPPDTWSLVRDDGRAVYVFSVPARVVAS